MSLGHYPVFDHFKLSGYFCLELHQKTNNNNHVTIARIFHTFPSLVGHTERSRALNEGRQPCDCICCVAMTSASRLFIELNVRFMVCFIFRGICMCVFFSICFFLLQIYNIYSIWLQIICFFMRVLENVDDIIQVNRETLLFCGKWLCFHLMYKMKPHAL